MQTLTLNDFETTGSIFVEITPNTTIDIPQGISDGQIGTIVLVKEGGSTRTLRVRQDREWVAAEFGALQRVVRRNI